VYARGGVLVELSGEEMLGVPEWRAVVETEGRVVRVGTADTCGSRSARPMLALATDVALRCVLKLAAVWRERWVEKLGRSSCGEGAREREDGERASGRATGVNSIERSVVKLK
jgi:hypothetical protein